MAETTLDISSQAEALARRVAQQVKAGSITYGKRYVKGIVFGTEVQISQYSGFASAPGELVYSTDGHRLYLFDGTKQGGYPVAMKGDIVQTAATATATGLAAGVAPTVSVTSSDKGFSFTFGIPKGEKGDQGDTGPKGDPGDAGTSLMFSVEGNSAAPVALKGLRVTQSADGKGVKSLLVTTTEGGVNRELAVQTDTSGLVSREGDRGRLAGYEAITADTAALTIDQDSPDDQITSGAVTVQPTDTSDICWTKTVTLTAETPVVRLGGGWRWVGDSAPTLKQYGLLVLARRKNVGTANFITRGS